MLKATRKLLTDMNAQIVQVPLDCASYIQNSSQVCVGKMFVRCDVNLKTVIVEV